ncbi:MAG: hypothetical protein IJP74_01665 [Prevotella sp.]|nr:hypothetical protein [Prevotella sp.]
MQKAYQQANAVLHLISVRVENESQKVKGETAAARKATDAAIRSAYDVLNALAVLQPSDALTQLITLLFSIEDRAKLYYISGGSTSGGDKPTPTPDGGDTPTPTPDLTPDPTPDPAPEPTPDPSGGGGGDE